MVVQPDPSTIIRKRKAKVAEITKPDEFEGREIMVLKTVDFRVLAQLGLEKEVREKFQAIGWDKFLDWDTTTYSSLV